MICAECGGNRTEEQCNICDLLADGLAPGGIPTSGWPMVSEALAVHPKQVEQANDRARRHGIPVTYDRKGFCHIPDRAARKKLLKLEGMHDNSGGYGD